MGNDIDLGTPVQIKEFKDKVKFMYLTTAFPLGIDRKLYGNLIEYIQNESITGKEKYQETINYA